MSEYLGVPVVRAFVRKRSQHYISPSSDFDFSVSNFYKNLGSNNVQNSNMFFLDEIGVGMVAPLFANRSNYVEGAILASGVYTTQHPVKGEKESDTEIHRRVFVPGPTLHQNLYGGFAPFGTAISVNYQGPLFDNVLQQPPTAPGCTENVYWIIQRSAANNVEWFLSQKEGNFKNQSFWIDVYKNKSVKMDAIDPEGFNRYYRYGREVRAYFAVRIGWNTDNPLDYVDPRNPGGNNGPIDVVFPIDGTPFIYDHGGNFQDGSKETDTSGKYVMFSKNGFIASEQANWTLPDDLENFRLMFFIVKGQLVIKSSFASEAWVFPQNATANLSKRTQEHYKKFNISKGKVCIMGRGFKFRMSYNPLEFNIYERGKEIDSPHARMALGPVQQRTNYPGGSNFRQAEWQDLYKYKNGKDNGFNNFFVTPNAEGDASPSGEYTVCSYGMDVDETGEHTGMMIPVEGADPHSSSFNPGSPSAVVWTELRSPAGNERTSPKTTITKGNAYGFDEKIKQGGIVVDNQFIDIGLNCLEPDVPGTSKRFASPVIWRVKGRNSIPEPMATPYYEITRFIKQISYNTETANLETVRQKYTIDVLIPQSYQTDFLDGWTREQLFNLLDNGLCEIELYIGWEGGMQDPALSSSNIYDDWDVVNIGQNCTNTNWTFLGNAVKVFTGLMSAGSFSQMYGEDILQMKCEDKIKIIEEFKFLNSPFYDGMNVDDAFYHIGTLGGLPHSFFRCDSIRAKTNVLGSGYTIQEPKYKFGDNMSLFDGMRKVASLFYHVIRTDPDGVIVLTDLNASSTMSPDGSDRLMVLEDLEISDPSFVFYVDGSKAPNPFQRMHDKFTLNKNYSDMYTQMMITTVDKYDGAIVVDGKAFNIEAIENPESSDFMGYRKYFNYKEPAIGSREKAMNLRDKMSHHIFQPPYTITFTVYGRSTLRPFDIIKVVFPDYDDTAFAYYMTHLNGKYVKEMNFRVIAIAGQISVENKMLHTMTITATHA